MIERLPPGLRQWLRLLRPSAFFRLLRRVLRRHWRRFSGVERRLVELQPESGVEVWGDALVAYIVDAVLDMDEELPVTHTHFWETRQIVQTFLDLGLRVDVVHWTNFEFVPDKPYRVALDVRHLLPRWRDHLPDDCLCIFHGETSHASFNDRAQEERHRAFEERHGNRLPERKAIGDTPAFAAADAATILGNETTLSTYRDVLRRGAVNDDLTGPEIWPVTISAPAQYPRLERAIESCRRRFVWLGSEGLVHKGLDLVLEAFRELPEHDLTVCGPIEREREFERFYWHDLYAAPNVHTYGWVDVTSDAFLRLAQSSLFLIYPSCSEGQCGSVVTCMHAGLVPLVSDRTGVPMDPSYSMELANPSVASLRRAILEISERPAEKLQTMSDCARAYARSHHNKERFAANYRAAIEEIFARHFPQGESA
ncbi:MAG: glycosyltransferase [Thermoanaerobaculia bacterium]|nr:glycosyltransferase [Thermoanaerobaculia bacterium]